MKMLRFWLDFAKRCLTAWDELSTEMDFSPFRAKKKSGGN